MIKALVFDVGETLIDETRIWSRWADRLGVPSLTFAGVLGGVAALGRPLRDTFRIIRPGIDVAAEEAAWERDEPDSMRNRFDADDLYPDVRGALAAIRDAGYQVIIAGNQPARAYDQLLAMDLPAESIHTSMGWGVSKPKPEFFAKVVAVAGREPAEIVYVGDRLDNDVRPARAAGMRTALIRRGPWGFMHADRPEAAETADLIIDGLDELLPNLPKLA